jgi:hypothetical protein
VHAVTRTADDAVSGPGSGDELVEVGGVGPGCGGLVAVLLSFDAQHHPPLLVIRGRVGFGSRLVLERR